MALWTKVLRHGFANSCLVFASKKALHQCAQQRLNFVPKFCTTNSLILPQRNSTTVSSTTNSDKNDGDTDSINDEAPIEWTSSEPEEFTLALSEELMQELSGGDPEMIKRIKFIQLEHEIARQEGLMVPSKPMKINKWRELIQLESKAKRARFYEFLFKLEKTSENDEKRKQKRRQEREELLATYPELPPLGEDPDGTIYGLHRNTLFLRLYEQTINTFYYHRLAQETMYGQTLVLDCSYGDYMTVQETKNCSKQMEFIYSVNRAHTNPFNIYICNAHRNDLLIRELNRRLPNLCNNDVPFNITSKSYLDLYPKEELIYISPHAQEDLLEINPNATYIIGCLVNKADTRPRVLAKAKREGVRVVKLPFDRYLDWGLGHKVLPLNQITSIMLDQRLYKDWNKSLLHVPRRKLRGWQGRPIYKEAAHGEDQEEDENGDFYSRNRSTFRRPQSYGSGYQNQQGDEYEDSYSRNRNTFRRQPTFGRGYQNQQRDENEDSYSRNRNTFSRQPTFGRGYQNQQGDEYEDSYSRNRNTFSRQPTFGRGYQNQQGDEYEDSYSRNRNTFSRPPTFGRGHVDQQGENVDPFLKNSLKRQPPYGGEDSQNKEKGELPNSKEKRKTITSGGFKVAPLLK